MASLLLCCCCIVVCLKLWGLCLCWEKQAVSVQKQEKKYIGEKRIPCLRFFFISFYDKVRGEGFYWVIFICKLDQLVFLGLGVTGG